MATFGDHCHHKLWPLAALCDRLGVGRPGDPLLDRSHSGRQRRPPRTGWAGVGWGSCRGLRVSGLGAWPLCPPRRLALGPGRRPGGGVAADPI
jgi:hypothetical protein